MTHDEAKKKSDEVAAYAAQILHDNFKDEEELRHRYLELATSFLTVSINVDKDLKDINDDIKESLQEIYQMALGGIIRYKSGDEGNVVDRFDN